MSRGPSAANRRNARDEYQWLKDQGICVACRSAEVTLMDGVTCRSCKPARKKRSAAFRTKKLGLEARPCYRCLAAPPTPGMKSCQACRDYQASYRQLQLVEKLVAA